MTVYLILLVVFTILSLLTNILVAGSRFKFLLFFIIPVQLAMSAGGYLVFESTFGKANVHVEELEQKFLYIEHHMVGNDLYLHVIPNGAQEPKLYVWMNFASKSDGDKKEIMKKLETMKAEAAEGWAVEGELDLNDSTLQFRVNKNYEEIHPKEAN